MKKTMAVIGVTGLIIALLAVVSFARGGRHGFGWHGGPGAFDHRIETMLEHMSDRLELTHAQRDQIFAVLDNTRPAMRQIRFALADQRRVFKNLDPEDEAYPARLEDMADAVGKLMAQMMVLLGETRARVAALLTETQREQMQQMIQEHGGHHRRRDR